MTPTVAEVAEVWLMVNIYIGFATWYGITYILNNVSNSKRHSTKHESSWGAKSLTLKYHKQ